MGAFMFKCFPQSWWALFRADWMIWHCRKGTGVTEAINGGFFFPFRLLTPAFGKIMEYSLQIDTHCLRNINCKMQPPKSRFSQEMYLGPDRFGCRVVKGRSGLRSIMLVSSHISPKWHSTAQFTSDSCFRCGHCSLATVHNYFDSGYYSSRTACHSN